MENGFFFQRLEYDEGKVLRNHNLEDNGKVQKFIDAEVIRLCDPLAPFDVGTLKDSAQRNTQIGSGEVKYRTPYARRWYYMPAKFQGSPTRGNYWFERMKKNGGKDQILKGAGKLLGGNI